jgi:uncharacterized protein (TIGR00251 family)
VYIIKPYSITESGVRLRIHLTPNAAHERLHALDYDAKGHARIRATVTAPPEKGKANTSLIKMLSKKLRLPKTNIQIIAGHHAREKSVLVTGDSDVIQALIDDLLADF